MFNRSTVPPMLLISRLHLVELQRDEKKVKYQKTTTRNRLHPRATHLFLSCSYPPATINRLYPRGPPTCSLRVRTRAHSAQSSSSSWGCGVRGQCRRTSLACDWSTGRPCGPTLLCDWPTSTAAAHRGSGLTAGRAGPTQCGSCSRSKSTGYCFRCATVERERERESDYDVFLFLYAIF